MIAIEQSPANPNNYSKGRSYFGLKAKVTAIVIHRTGGSLQSALNTFASPNLSPHERSAHYVVNANRIVQCVAEENTAWQAGNWHENCYSLGIEHEGWNGLQGVADHWVDEGTYNNGTDLAADICFRYGLNPFNDIHPHKDFSATACPVDIDMDRYRRMVAAKLISLQNGQIPSNPPAPVPAPQPAPAPHATVAGDLVPGLRNNAKVKVLQDVLKAQGFLDRSIDSTGNYLDLTIAAVLRAQVKYGIMSATAKYGSTYGAGYCGPKTAAALNSH